MYEYFPSQVNRDSVQILESSGSRLQPHPMVDQGLSSLADLRTSLEKKDDHCASVENKDNHCTSSDDRDVRLAGFLPCPDFDSSGQLEAQV